MQKNNGKAFFNYRIRDKGKKINVFDKINTIKKDIKELLPEIEDDKIVIMFSHIRSEYEGKLHYGRRGMPENLKKKKQLTEAEKIVYDYMLKNNLNPATTYRWFLACRVPSDIKEKLGQGKISYKLAMIISANRLKAKESNLGLLMMEEINNIVRSL
jgi:hypothetical protein